MTGVILEIASGSGEHVVHFARNLPSLVFQPSDPEPEALLSVAAWVKEAQVTNVRAPIVLDASQSAWPIASADGIICINMVHISPWDATVGLIRGAAAILPPGSPLYLYGPSHGELWVKSVFIRACVKLRGLVSVSEVRARLHDAARFRARSTSHTVAARDGCTNIPLAAGRGSGDETILSIGM